MSKTDRQALFDAAASFASIARSDTRFNYAFCNWYCLVEYIPGLDDFQHEPEERVSQVTVVFM